MQFKANEEIRLTQTRIRLDVNGQCVDGPAQVILRMLPRPRLVIKCDLDLRDLDAGPADFQRSYITATVLDQQREFIVGQFTFPWGAGNFQAGMTLLPKREPISVHHTHDDIASVEFGVLNFPEFLGEQDKVIESNGSYKRVGAIKIQADPSWVIDITAAPNLSEVKQSLDTTGGYGITHTGTVARADGADFSTADVERLLHGLSLFLSFARGAYCGLALVKGRNRDGEVVWERWGAGPVTGWFNPLSWFDRHHAHLLANVFPGFWRRYRESEEGLRTVVSLYLDSNLGRSHGVGLDGGLILTQAALERMAHTVDSGKTGKRIAKALVKNGIAEKALPIPPDSCSDLARLGSQHGWKHGPHAFVEVRNTVVHPNQKYGKISARAYYEAWNLGQWYLELMLLSLFGASGEYGNRLRQKWVGEVEPLGQWLVENMPRGLDLELPSRDEPERPTSFVAHEAK
ncbi:MAG: hypothetical protein OXO48_19450 [Caldilineaceae bacterium]|nr:hypothetical protein [Caldilineaceae bacterium]